MAKVRTINGAVEEIKKNDPDTAITAHAIRKKCIEGTIPCAKVGNKYLVNVDDVEKHFTGN